MTERARGVACGDEAFLVIDTQSEEGVGAGNQGDEGSYGAYLRAPFPEHAEFQDKDQWKDEKREGHLAKGKEPEDHEYTCKNQTYRADETEDRKAEDQCREQGATQHDIAGIKADSSEYPR